MCCIASQGSQQVIVLAELHRTTAGLRTPSHASPQLCEQHPWTGPLLLPASRQRASQLQPPPLSWPVAGAVAALPGPWSAPWGASASPSTSTSTSPSTLGTCDSTTCTASWRRNGSRSGQWRTPPHLPHLLQRAWGTNLKPVFRTSPSHASPTPPLFVLCLCTPTQLLSVLLPLGCSAAVASAACALASARGRCVSA